MIITELIYNLSVLVALSVLSGFLNTRFNSTKMLGLILQGILFGCVAIIGMMFPFVLSAGIIFDGRSVVIGLCTLFFGPISGIIASLMSIAFRNYLGGNGALMGSLVITSSFLMGYLFHKLKKKGKFKSSYLGLYLFGFLVSALMLGLMITLPAVNRSGAFSTLAITVIIFYPLITMIIGKIFLDQENSRTFLSNLEFERNLYKTTLYSIGDAVITTDEKGNVRQMNHVAERLTGWKESEAAGKSLISVFNIINEETKEKVNSPVEIVLTNGITVELANHTLLVSKTGAEIPIADSGSPIINESGEITGVVLVFRDQTRERAARKALLEQKRKYRYLFDNNPQTMWIYDLETLRFLEVNEAALRHYGYTKEEFLNLTIKDIRPKEDVPDLIKNLKERIGEIRTSGNWRHVKKNGEIIHVNIITHNIKYENRKARLVLVNDITEQIESETSLIESEERYRSLVEYSPDAIAVYRYGKFLYINPAGVKLIGAKDESEILKMSVMDIIHPDYIEAVRKRVKRSVHDRSPESVEEEKFIRMDGGVVDVEVVSALISLNGLPAVQIIARDITERKKVQDELIRAKEKAEEMSRLKSSFLANMSHEIRTPLIGILGYAEILEEEEDISEIKQLASTIRSCGVRLMRTLNQVLNLSSIESNKQQVQICKVNIAELALNCVIFYKAYAAKENLTLEALIKEQESIAMADEGMVTQILDNLVHNALKFTTEGKVIIEVGRENENGKEYIVTRVIDTGIGLSKENQDIIFDEFRQVSEGFSRSYQGTGLGLTITRKFIHLLGGDISVVSEPGKGSTFTVRLPGANMLQ